jgi:hypothetical protein
MLPCRNQRAVDDPRAAPVTAGDVVEEYGEPGRDRRDDPVPADFEIWNTTANSRIVRFVCNAAQAISTR